MHIVEVCFNRKCKFLPARFWAANTGYNRFPGGLETLDSLTKKLGPASYRKVNPCSVMQKRQ